MPIPWLIGAAVAAVGGAIIAGASSGGGGGGGYITHNNREEEEKKAREKAELERKIQTLEYDIQDLQSREQTCKNNINNLVNNSNLVCISPTDMNVYPTSYKAIYHHEDADFANLVQELYGRKHTVTAKELKEYLNTYNALNFDLNKMN